MAGRIVLIISATAGQFQALAQNGNTYIVSDTATPCARMRRSPSGTARVLKCVEPGTRVEAIGDARFWRKIRLANGHTGWVAKRLLEPASPVPTATAPGAIPEDAWLEVHFIDVGQGDGIWIHTYDDGIDGNGVFEGRDVVIDGGPDASDSKNAMLAYLKKHAQLGTVIDTLIVTHPHDDHYPGADGVLRHYEVRNVYDPGYPKQGPGYAAFLAEERSETVGGHPSRVMVGRDHFAPLSWGSELNAEILYAYPGSPAGLGAKTNTVENNASIVLRVQYGEHVFLFMGDAEGKDRKDSPDEAKFVEKILLETVPERLKATVLKIAHHGSETSSSLPFIRAVDPDVVVVCSGRKKFGTTFLPDVSTLERYCEHKASTRIYRTDQNDEQEGRTTADDADNDDIIIRTNGHVIEVTAFENGHPFTVSTCNPN